MAVWKQLIAVAVIVLFAVTGWFQLSQSAAPSAGLSVRGGSEPGAHGERSRGREGMRGGGRFRGGEGARERGPIRVVTAEVVEAEAGNRLAAIGTAQAARSVTLYSQTTGIVSEVTFAPGDLVSAGDVLVRLDDAEQRIALEQAKIDLEAAEDTVARYDRLSQNQTISAVQAEEARAIAARARNELAAAELALSRRSAAAPFDGVMGFAQVDVGDMLTNTTPVANIDDRRTLLVEFSVPERFAALVAQGRQVTATTAAYGAEQFTGEVVALDSRVEATSRTLRIRAGLPNHDDRLRPGMAFSVTLEFDTPGRPAVPKVAVQWDRDGAYVWKVVDGKAVRTAVRVVARTADAVLVEGDVAPADIVVAEGLETLRDGSEVADAGDAARDAARL